MIEIGDTFIGIKSIHSRSAQNRFKTAHQADTDDSLQKSRVKNLKKSGKAKSERKLPDIGTEVLRR
jgi:hypothetical protein